jgi:hypothetical protein
MEQGGGGNDLWGKERVLLMTVLVLSLIGLLIAIILDNRDYHKKNGKQL